MRTKTGIISLTLLCAAGIWAQERTPAERLERARQALGWRFGAACSAAGTLTDAAENAKGAGVKFIEACSDQKAGGTVRKAVNEKLKPADVQALKARLNEAGVAAPVLSVRKSPSSEAGWRQVLEVARGLGAEVVAAYVKPESLEMVDRLATQTGVAVALEGGAFADPAKAAELLKPSGPKMGVVADLGRWLTAGAKPPEALAALKGRVQVVRVAAGTPNLEGLFKEMYRLEMKPLFFSVPEFRGAEAGKALELVATAVTPVASFHSDYASRTPGVRRFGEVTAEERAKIEAALPGRAPAKPKRPRRLLVVDMNIGRGPHPAIPHANLAVELMGRKTGAYETVVSHEVSALAYENLRKFDAVFFNNTTGELFPTPEMREGFVKYINEGGGMLANHAVTVTSEKWTEFGEILGARGASHRMTDEKVIIRPEPPETPLTAMFEGKSFEFADEIFRYQAPYSRERLRVLLSIDVEKTDMNQGRCYGKCVREDNDYAISWIRNHGKGRVFYSTVGHNPYVFWDARMLAHFLAGIQFAFGDLDVDASPTAATAR